ncbi:LytTR family DNA-binding domain-containing protein [Roseateles sp.]|uniref:LytR/AlgR family response regulator transcription factor n=1 Tax=Roseateles sp. TaxID=1971397 RepID=UPI0025DDD5D6|nr:LytTR family DNA-binding domain-containing protein [Roseateles sp.]MBV8034436.1 response regulator transcription factor [Roseateles sp.]
MPTAVLIEDEALPRADLREQLERLWPELEIVGEAEDGLQGLALVSARRPDIAFVDIRLPGMSGIELAQGISRHVHLVFVTALDQHALAAFEQGAVDYLLKPLQPARLAQTVQRLRQRLQQAPPDLGGLLRALQAGAAGTDTGTTGPLRWLQVGQGDQLRLITVGDVLFFRAETKYTQVVTGGGSWWVRLSLKELVERLDGQQFWQVHRNAIVNLAHVDWVERNALGHMTVHLKNHPERLGISQSFQARFKQM